MSVTNCKRGGGVNSHLLLALPSADAASWILSLERGIFGTICFIQTTATTVEIATLGHSLDTL